MVLILAHQHGNHRFSQRCGENAVLEGRPALTLRGVSDTARQPAMRAVPAVLLVEGLGACVSQAGADLDVGVLRHDVSLLVTLVLDAEVVGQPAVAVKSTAGVRKELDGHVEGDLGEEKRRRSE